jgi:hypothetical protein
MINFKKIIKEYWWVVLIFILAHLGQFWPVYFQHLLPFPGDMLVAFYFPWSGGGFAGFDPWTQYKALNTVDTIKQFYPWKVLAFDAIRQGFWPLWNPYNFSGMPLVANLQSGLFFPANLIYLVLPVLWGWVSNVMFQLSLFGVFFCLFLRSEGLSKLAAVFGAVVAMNISYIALWHWQLVITQSLLFLPLILFVVNKYSKLHNSYFIILNSILLAFCFFGGHAQTTIYVYLIYGLFALFRKVSLKLILLTMILPLFLAAVQLVPSIEAYLLSAREGAATKDLFAPFVFPWRKMITVVAPNFFGHPTNRNYFGMDYRDFNAYFGITAFVFSILSLGWFKVSKNIRFYLLLALIGLLFSIKPLAFIFDVFNVPILSSGVPARMIFVFQFAGAVLAAYGFEYWWKEKKYSLRGLVILGVIIGILWLWSLITSNNVARNNLILPTIFFATTSLLIFWQTKIAIALIFVILFFQYSYFFHQYNSFAPEKFVFPKHPVLAYLQKNAGIDRFFGTENAILDQNFATIYKIFDFKGYDSMYLRRYGELVAAAETGKMPAIVPRSDAYINHWSDRQSERLLDLLGVKYLLDKDDGLKSDWDEEPAKFPPEKYQLLWQRRPWRVYERKTALPRVVLFGDYQVETDNNKILEKLYEVNFDYQKQLILEESPEIVLKKATKVKANIISYEPNNVRIRTDSDVPQLLFLSDNYYPGWKALVDGKKTEILRANYTFRAVALPAGSHEVIFDYDPLSFKIGAGISIISCISLGIFAVWRRKS